MSAHGMGRVLFASLLVSLLVAPAGTAWSRYGVRPVASPARIEQAPAASLRAPRIIVAWGPHARLATRRALWDLARGVVIAELRPESESVSWCGDVLVTLVPGGLFWRNGATGAVLATAAPLTRPNKLICSPDGRHALAFGDGAEVWDTTSHTGRKLGSDWVGWAAWGPRDRVALAVPEAFEIWRIDGDEPAREHRRPGWTGVIAWRRDGLIAADIRAYRRRGDVEETGLVELRGPKLKPGRWLTVCYPDSLDHCPCRAAAWSPDGRRLAAIVEVSLQVSEVDRKRVRPARIPLVHLRDPRAISWSPDGSALASADRDGVTLVRMHDGATIRLREDWDGIGLSGVVQPNSLPRFLGATR